MGLMGAVRAVRRVKVRAATAMREKGEIDDSDWMEVEVKCNDVLMEREKEEKKVR